MYTFRGYSSRRYYNTGSGAVTKTFNSKDYTSIILMDEAVNDYKGNLEQDNEAFKKDRLNGKYPRADMPWINNDKFIPSSTQKEIPIVESDIIEVPVLEDSIVKVSKKLISTLPEQLADIDIDFDKPEQSSIVVIGSSKRGKSTLLEYLFNKYYNKPEYISTVFSPNAHLDFYKGFNAKCSSFDHRAQNYIHLEQKINRRTKNHYKFFNAFDDIIDSKYTDTLNDLICTFRNSNMSTIMLIQYYAMMSKQNRTNLNHIILFGFNQEEAIEQIVKLYCKGFFLRMGMKSMAEMVEFYKKMTDAHGYIYIDPIKDNISFHKLIIKSSKKKKKKKKRKTKKIKEDDI